VNVQVQLAVQDSAVPETPTIVSWVNTTLLATPHHLTEITVRVISKGEMLNLNSRFRGQKAPTNVLSFPSEETPNIETGISGDIAVCAAVVRSEAVEQNKTLDAHWAHMMIHAVLHLCGYDHINDVEAAIMEALEVQVLDKLGFGDPYNIC
jgi:probable rRNA maturation factor|tara:strand:- start:257 stop:709 length:453 start_codon:yes stop_codon:yes gene_type:complete